MTIYPGFTAMSYCGLSAVSGILEKMDFSLHGNTDIIIDFTNFITAPGLTGLRKRKVFN
jgi:hypothetical protein